MVDGKVAVRGTMPGFLFFGLSWQHLWWTDRDGTRASRRRLITSGGTAPAAACRVCGLVAIQPFAAQ
jgi:hypothetical protein